MKYHHRLRLELMFAAALGLAALPRLQAASTHRGDGDGDNDREERIVAVAGQDTVRIPATLARITVMIEAREKTSEAAQKAAAERSTSVLAALKKAAVERLQAGAMSLNPIYEPRPSRSSMGQPDANVIGYLAQWSASFDIAAERAGEIVGAAVDAGASRIASFEFTASDEELEAAKSRALQGAARRAREDARAVLAALGYEAGEVVKINVNSNGPIIPLQRTRDFMTMSAAAESAAPAAVEPGFIDVNGSVSLEISY